MKEEMKAWSKDKRAIGCRWIYIVKCKSDEILEQYKARLVAKGCTQTYGIDYEKAFALVAKMNTPPTLARTCNSLMLKMSSFMETRKRSLHGDSPRILFS
ncbi:hypothetical protein CR513_53665, partial [Mucuna pruriens]